MYPAIDFLYLSEPDMIEAGVLDASRCVEVCEETFRLLGEGDYLMGGANHNNHGMNIVFPKETGFPNMPVAGPDRRFAAMPGYLGGRFDVCGNKWYGSNHENASKGLPRSILTLMLNDKDTGRAACPDVGESAERRAHGRRSRRRCETPGTGGFEGRFHRGLRSDQQGLLQRDRHAVERSGTGGVLRSLPATRPMQWLHG